MKTLQYIAISASVLLIGACSSSYYASSSSGESDGIYYSGQRSAESGYYTGPQQSANQQAVEQLYNKTQTAINSSEQPAVGSGQSTAGNMQKVDNSTQYTAGNEAVTDVIIDEDDSYARRLRMFDQAEYERPANTGTVNINLVGAGYPSYYAWYGNYYNPWHWRYSTYYRYPWYWDSWYYPYYYPSYHYAWYGYGHYYHTPYYYYPHYYNHHHHNNYYANNARNRRGAPTIGARHTNRSQARLPQIQQVNSNRRQTAQYGRNTSTSTNVRNTGYRSTAGVNNAINTSNESGRPTQRQYTRVNRNTDNSQRYYNTNTPTTNTNVNNNRSSTVNYRRSDSNSSRYNNTNTYNTNTYNVSNTNTNSSQPSYSRESRPSSSSSGATSSGRSSGSSSGRRR